MKKLYLILIIIFVSLNLRPAITSVGPLLGQIQADLHISAGSASLITTLPVLCMGLFSLLAIKISQRFSVEKALFIAMLLLFVATLARFFVDSLTSLLLTALIAGIGIGIVGPLIAGFIKKHFPENNGMMSFYSVSMVVGAAVASSFTIPLFTAFNESWQMSLSFWSLLAVIAALLLLPLIKNSPTNKNQLVKLSSLWHQAFPMMLFFSFMAAIFYILTAWLSPYVQATGMSRYHSGLLLAVFTGVQIPVSFLIPLLVTRFGKQYLWLIFCGIAELLGVLFLIGGLSPWFSTIILGIGAGGLFPLALLLPMTRAQTSQEAISLSALMQFGGFIIGACGPLLFGLMIDYFGNFSLAWGMVVILIVTMLASVIKIARASY
ncbi:CynX/NimT family MFS transporter [Brochothrix thermosphacta]|uniref:MFS transporter n=1 Tax=Brochothrix thermosphacta TaxID=2756 RepID=A0A1D2LNN7_BROTH|nr:MFS transporter [Brochothrix thermosphacta]ATF25797.1 MFS transporter [Brochothrix thermosphacta]ATH85133.1 MFS transporter [Brochothrix thermosphacta]MPQ28505.1 MFS transporter [Brochothrix thermosphacta]ODJ65001.1 MFS transporter [Brochothrix thermosphacta]ODJ71578.1 MFS transporter [Brochothrix thermosphacta]